ncbi:MAG: helix-turn-helix transcriptional regulator [Burkholderiales bacterium]
MRNFVITQPQVDRLIRLPDVLAMYPVSRSSWYAGIKNGIYPEPEKIGKRSSAWRVSAILRLIEQGI